VSRHHSDPKPVAGAVRSYRHCGRLLDAAEAFQTSSPLHQPHPNQRRQHTRIALRTRSPRRSCAASWERGPKTASKESQIHSELQQFGRQLPETAGRAQATPESIFRVQQNRRPPRQMPGDARPPWPKMKALVNQRSGQRARPACC
uniref:Integron gene cassette protein n=1 Tax=Macrostomum lignano TaxID=282301 RepID=A0A1I8F7Q3_9PLAT